MPLFRYRLVLSVFIVCLVASGVTAFPLLGELRLLTEWLGHGHVTSTVGLSGTVSWIVTVRLGLEDMYANYPWIAYGTDWLAFGHIVIALFFLPAWWRPQTSRPTLLVGMVACVGVLPLAFICGPLRAIPFYWRLIDCSFGVFGILPLAYCWKQVGKMEGT